MNDDALLDECIIIVGSESDVGVGYQTYDGVNRIECILELCASELELFILNTTAMHHMWYQ